MQPEFWLRAWEDGKTGFHRDAVHDDLLSQQERFLPGTHRVLVPLCGKSMDLIWLAEQGHEVVGVELSPRAVEQFFDQHHLDHQRDGDVCRSGRIEVVCGNVFEVTGLGTFDRIWDRAALVALHPEQREAYVTRLEHWLADDGEVLLNAFTYDQSLRDGPPWSVPEDTVRSLWSPREVDVLRADEVAGQVKFDLPSWVVSTYHIR